MSQKIYRMAVRLYFPGWIANLGVVPWFLFLAFLLLPALDCLFFLIVRVCCVFDAITYYLFHIPSFRKDYKAQYLPRFRVLVNLILLIAPPILSFFPAESVAKGAESLIFLSKGEQKPIKPPKYHKYSVGNKQVLKFKERPGDKSFLIKGISVGFSDLKFWKNQKLVSSYRIFVLSKREQLNLAKSAESLKKLNLDLELYGDTVRVTGTVTNISDYMYLKKIEKGHKKLHLSSIQLAPKLKRKILIKIYQRLHTLRPSYFQCQFDGLDTLCFVPKDILKSPSLKAISKQYFVHFFQAPGSVREQNYRVTLKIIQLEQMKRDQRQLGLDQISISIPNLFQAETSQMGQAARIWLGKQNIEMSTLAQPEFLVSENSFAEFSIGSDIPYQTTNRESSHTEWFFSGMKIKLKIQKSASRYRVIYQATLNSRQDTNINGGREKSELLIDLDTPFEVFNLGQQTSKELEQKVPILGSIPIIGNFFSRVEKEQGYKKIVGVLNVEEF